MSYQESRERMNHLRMEILKLRQELKTEQQKGEAEEVKDYVFLTGDGPVKLSELFGDKDTLFIIHNMGPECPYCTLWADGFNGVLPHLEDRAAFVVSTPDTPENQRKFAESRGWNFRLVSYEGTEFPTDMGYMSEMGYEPGVSVFKLKDGKPVRVSDTSFGPGDDFCFVWHLLDLIPEGPAGWQPRYSY
jgi:predicted dithiol-disulfide oxidoreductase (DUF899 family)